MELLQPFAAVGAVLGLLAATLWWLGRRGFATRLAVGRPNSRRLECLERLALAPQHTLHLVRLGDTALLLASTPAGCVVVRSLPAAEIDGPRQGGR
jgi:flagellar biogenesis protein FliO